MTSRDVARAAGVSQSAVSRAFARAPGVSEPTRARILEVAAGLGYQPNALASGLITRRSGMVGVVISLLDNPFTAEATQGLLYALRANGLQVLAFPAGSDRDVDAAAIEFGRYSVDGCFVVSPHLPQTAASKFNRLGPTVLLFNREVPGLNASAVCVDDFAGGRRVADHLIARGHRRIGYVHGLAGAATSDDRYRGFVEGLAAHGLEPFVEASGGFKYAGGASAALSILSRPERPTAIFCAADVMAMGAMDVARSKLGLRVPDDIAIVGFDDATSAAWPSYDLTTVRQPIDTMIEAAIALMLGDDADVDKPVRRMLPAELVVRTSS